MIWGKNERSIRRHAVGDDDQRSRFARDRDRILYSSAFHRLSGVTQIVRAGEEDVFHNRQQHSLKVAQVGRRLAENCLEKTPSEAKKQGLDPEVVEAACLAHDLGHPPFGHAGEKVLDKLVQDSGDSDGFEGNAQTFRIITKLSVRHQYCHGLDLTRATLAACLKYPWMRDLKDKNKKNKWSAYKTEKDDFDFARKFHSHHEKTLEAELMDWADDIAYSVHDLEDFHRCNAVPWGIIFRKNEKKALINNALGSWHNAPVNASGQLGKAMEGLEAVFGLFEGILLEPYVGSREQRQALRNFTSTLIGRYMHAVNITEGGKSLDIKILHQCEVNLLKQITRDYIFTTPALLAQQEGQSRIIEDLFKKIYASSRNNVCPSFLPHRLGYLWQLAEEENAGKDHKARFAADCISSLTENEVIGLHSRLFGRSSGSVLHPIVR